MSKNQMMIDERHGRVRVALLKDGVLVDYTEEEVESGQLRGNIYKGVVARVEPSLQAAFIDIGDKRHGFLQIRDVHSRCYPEGFSADGPPQIQDVLRRKQSILVQVNRDPVRSKGADLTTHISMAGRYLVLMPEEEGAGGISRRIADSRDRERLRDIVSKLSKPKDVSVIIRTVGRGSIKRELERDLARLLRLWGKIKDDYRKNPAPFLLLREEDAAIRALRDYLTPDVREVILGSRTLADRMSAYVRTVMPRTGVKFSVHQGPDLLMVDTGVEKQVLECLKPVVPLPSGGSLVIQVTEALVAVDVNSGKSTKGSGSEETAFSTNIEAANALARELRLRDLGGLIVVDFIDMVSDEHKQQVERAFRAALRDDKARVRIGHISSFGMLELSRQRLRRSLYTLRTVSCVECTGNGRVSDPVLRADHALDLVDGFGPSEALVRLVLETDAATANVLMNDYRTALVELERANNLKVRLQINRGADISPKLTEDSKVLTERQYLANEREREPADLRREQDGQSQRKKRRPRHRRPAHSGATEGADGRSDRRDSDQQTDAKRQGGTADRKGKSHRRSFGRRYDRRREVIPESGVSGEQKPKRATKRGGIGGFLKRLVSKD